MSWSGAKSDRIEAFLVLSVLVPTVVFTGGEPKDVVAACAVFLSFLCSQAAFNLGDQQSGTLCRELSKQYRHLYIAKELCWIATCILLHSYPLLASTALFATYPYWRRAIRGKTHRRPVVLEPILEIPEREESLTDVESVALQYLH